MQAVQAIAPVLPRIVDSFAKLLLALVPLLPPLVNLAAEILPVAVKQFTVLLPVIVPLLGALANLAAVLVPVVSWIVQVIAAVLNWVANLNNLKGVVSDVTSFITGSWDKTYSQVSAIIGKLVAFFAASWDQTASEAKTAWNAIASFFTSIWNTIYKSISSVITTITSFLSGAWTKMATDAKNIWNGLVTWVTSTLPGAFKSAFQAILNGISSVWNTLQAIVTKPVDFIINTIYDKGIVPVVNAVGGLIGLHLKPVAGLAAGGKVTQGTTGTADDVLARVSKGETVVSAVHSQQLAPIFAAAGVPGYAAGGIPGGGVVGDIGHAASGALSDIAGALGDVGKVLSHLAGDALAAAVTHLLVPLVNAMPGGGTVLGSDLKKIPVKMVDGLVAKLKGTASPGSDGGGGAPGAQGGPTSAGAAQAQAYAKSRLSAYGWDGGQMSPLISLWNEESGWNRLADNASSGAYGIPQALPGSKMGAAANPPTSSAAAQINWGLGYIKDRYRDPAAAWAFETSHSPNWYDGGGWMPPGLSLNMNGTGRPEPVLSGRQWDMISGAVAGGDGAALHSRAMAKKFDRMIHLLEQAPGRTAGGVGEALNGTARGAVQSAYFRTR
jgi:hypothetical protein